MVRRGRPPAPEAERLDAIRALITNPPTCGQHERRQRARSSGGGRRDVTMRGLTVECVVTIREAASDPPGQGLMVFDAERSRSGASPVSVKSITGQAIAGRTKIEHIDSLQSARLSRADPAP